MVHLSGTETVTGTKTFSSPPNVPTPVGAGDVTNKSYVDSSIEAVGAGNYLADGGRRDDGTVDIERQSDSAAAIGSKTICGCERDR